MGIRGGGRTCLRDLVFGLLGRWFWGRLLGRRRGRLRCGILRGDGCLLVGGLGCLLRLVL